jgi:hypothetical protein
MDMLLTVLNKSNEPKHYSSVKLALHVNYGWEATLVEIHVLCNSRPDMLFTNGDLIGIRPVYRNKNLVSNKEKSLREALEKHARIKEYQRQQKLKYEQEVLNERERV